MADEPEAGRPAGTHDERSACCAKGQCFCGCIVSAVFDVPLLAPAMHTLSVRRLAADEPGFPLARSSVLQRPPIR
ncbi:hypothetical protein SAMN05216289_103144 [Dokdonella immobilis]|uniref:Uncharacterized protein n=1 Tax=Dokdonella immobilis TaxID=578942 RepID=A0A1I4VX90_9GAMM|nr:hypothetical protein SAMN05216289_103144 [Dokdonella immobilis]